MASSSSSDEEGASRKRQKRERKEKKKEKKEKREKKEKKEKRDKKDKKERHRHDDGHAQAHSTQQQHPEEEMGSARTHAAAALVDASHAPDFVRAEALLRALLKAALRGGLFGAP